MENPYDKGVVIFEADLLPKELTESEDGSIPIALATLKDYGAVTIRSCKYFGWLVGAPPEIYRS